MDSCADRTVCRKQSLGSANLPDSLPTSASRTDEIEGLALKQKLDILEKGYHNCCKELEHTRAELKKAQRSIRDNQTSQAKEKRPVSTRQKIYELQKQLDEVKISTVEAIKLSHSQAENIILKDHIRQVDEQKQEREAAYKLTIAAYEKLLHDFHGLNDTLSRTVIQQSYQIANLNQPGLNAGQKRKDL